jgi:serine/threonine protein kinase
MATSNFVGRYELKERLGRGAMGDVYRALKMDSNEQFAIKVLRGDFSDDPEILTRFLQERAVLLRLDSPLLVRVRDLIIEGGSAAIVMDLLDGGDLRHRIDEVGKFSYAESITHLISVFGALEIVHDRGILHRDVKPENLLFSSDGSIHLADFGIAKLLDRPQLTQTYGVLGTPAYMAPEIGLDEETTPAVDVYSAGIVFYEMVTGQLPFRSKSPLSMMRLHAEADVPIPTGLPPQLEQFLGLVLAKIPEERLTAEEARLHLESIRSEFPVGSPLVLRSSSTGQVDTANVVPVGEGPVGVLPPMPDSSSDMTLSESMDDVDLMTQISRRTPQQLSDVPVAASPPEVVNSLETSSLGDGGPTGPASWTTLLTRRRLPIVIAISAVFLVVLSLALWPSAGSSGEPNRPTGLTTLNTVGGMKISWQAPKDSGVSITGYRVSDGATVAHVARTARDYVFVNPAFGRTYDITVGAASKSGTKESDVLQVTYFLKPSAPKVKARFARVGLVVTWRAPNSNGAPITSYRVSDGVKVAHTSGTVRRYVFTKPVPGRTYYVTVDAINKVGTTVSHPRLTLAMARATVPATVMATTTPSKKPSPITKHKHVPTSVRLGGPTNVTVVPSSQAASVEVQWSAPADANNYTIKGYSLDAFEVAGNDQTVISNIPAGSRSDLVTGLNDGLYTFTVTVYLEPRGSSVGLPYSLATSVTLSTSADGLINVSPG